jgi:hypothetical protein
VGTFPKDESEPRSDAGHRDWPIIQFSPPRTGSTLVYNLLRESCPEREIRKTHRLPPSFIDGGSRALAVCTIRHPLDSIASRILRFDHEPNGDAIRRNLHDRDRFDRLLDIRGDPRVLILRYERFFDDYDYAFDRIEDFLGIGVSKQVRKHLRRKYAIEAVRAKADSLGGFHHYDPLDHIHGNHISRFAGRPGYYREVFSALQIEQLESLFWEVLTGFGYESNDSDRPSPAVRS